MVKPNNLRENGVRFKADKKYSLAATSFLDAARQYSQLVDSGNRMDAGKCYEDASVMFKLAGQEQRSFDALEQAASTFETVPNLETRAAKIFETLSQKVVAVDGVKALRFLQRAQDLFLQVGDGRALYVEISKCNTLSQLQRFEEGFKGFESLIAQVAEHSALKFSAGKYALSAGVCAIGIPNVHLFTQLLQTCSNNPHVSFAWEYEKLKLLHEALKVEDLDN
ncbi:soluble NSF attachment protein [Chytridium lagenaria]|nr:soluble NSF attachment protein [Chytridium lagenaria]